MHEIIKRIEITKIFIIFSEFSINDEIFCLASQKEGLNLLYFNLSSSIILLFFKIFKGSSD